jgi:hypothetical protein
MLGTQTKGGLCGRPIVRNLVFSGLRGLHILGLPPFRAFDHIELHLLTFLQAAESVRLDCREVYEHVLAILAADKSIALGVVKPLYCSCFHGVAFVPLY